MARKRRRRSSAPKTRRRSSRRRSSGSTGARRGFAFLPPGALMATGGTVGGFLGTNLLLNAVAAKLPFVSEGYGRIAGKAGCAILGYMLLKRFAPQSLANGFVIGGLTSAGLDVFNRFVNKPAAMSGLGSYGIPEGVTYLPRAQMAYDDAAAYATQFA